MSSQKRYDSARHWYAIHTYSGYEEKVAESIQQRVESVDMADKISITICGDGGCGKSSITLRLVRSQWTSEYVTPSPSLNNLH